MRSARSSRTHEAEVDKRHAVTAGCEPAVVPGTMNWIEGWPIVPSGAAGAARIEELGTFCLAAAPGGPRSERAGC